MVKALNKKIVVLVGFLLAVAITFFAGFYRNVNNQERIRFSLNINQKKDGIIVVDLAKQSVFKYYLQPNILSFYGRGRMPVNTKNLSVKFTGLDNYASQGSKKSVWTELVNNEKLKIDGKGRLIINFEARLPWASTRRYHVAEAKCELFQDSNIVSVTKFNIINSNYKE